MMRGYDGVLDSKPAPPRHYRVVQSAEGWRVEVNGCFTGPIADRKVATRLARKLQRELNHLRHHRTGKPIQKLANAALS